MQNNQPDSTPVLAAASLFAGLCKLIPVPILDKILLRHVKRKMIASILALHNIECSPADIYPLYKNPNGCFITLLKLIFIWPFIIFYKIVIRILKWLFFILIIRETAMEMGKAVLLGHTVERCIADGRIPPPEKGDKKSYRRTVKAASKCRKKFEKAFKGSDRRFLIHIFRGIIQTIMKSPKLVKSAIKIIRAETDHSQIQNEIISSTEEEQSLFRKLLSEMTDIMKNREMQHYIANFDSNFDRLWGPHNE